MVQISLQDTARMMQHANVRREVAAVLCLGQRSPKPRLTTYRQLPPAKCRHLLIAQQTPSSQGVGSKPCESRVRPPSSSPPHRPSVTDNRHTDKDESFC